MKNQALFSSEDKKGKNLKCHLLQFLFGALRVKLRFQFPYDLQVTAMLNPESAHSFTLLQYSLVKR